MRCLLLIVVAPSPANWTYRFKLISSTERSSRDQCSSRGCCFELVSASVAAAAALWLALSHSLAAMSHVRRHTHTDARVRNRLGSSINRGLLLVFCACIVVGLLYYLRRKGNFNNLRLSMLLLFSATRLIVETLMAIRTARTTSQSNCSNYLPAGEPKATAASSELLDASLHRHTHTPAQPTCLCMYVCKTHL